MDVATQSEIPGWTLGKVRVSQRLSGAMCHAFFSLIHTTTTTTYARHQFVDYYEKPAHRRSKVLNVISLEFSSTPLFSHVRSPSVVRQIDWIDNVWPVSERAKGVFPQVQYYCLMSVAGCYTDFHVDFGGTSVWYHVVRGIKVFLLVPPSAANLRA